ncbi:MAG: hypothetical protein QOE98_363 [Gaiellaceae bacterium]|nr:hypothetical protein [Gaiellaceae bacterium]
MGGVDYDLRCSSCGVTHELRTGFSLSFTFEHFVCHRCESLVSVPYEQDVVPGPCKLCGLQLEPWRGRIWRDADGNDRLEGPCAACFAILTQEDAVITRRWD